MGELLGKCVGLISGTDWLRVRSITAPRFSHKESATYIPRIIEITENHFKELHKGGNLSASELHPVQDLKFLPFWVIADILYGELTSEMVEELKDLIQIREALWARMIQGGMTRFSWTWLRPTKEAEKLQVFKKRWAAFNQSARDACLLSQENAAIVEMYNAAEHGHLSMDELLQTLDEMLFANLDVTIGAISWIPLFLASHVEVQEQLREEIETNTRCGVQEASEYLLSSSTFLSACVLESARLRPLAPFSVPQSAPTARYVGGYVVPAGTDFTIDTYKLNIQNPVWGQDRETYNPARFLGKKGSSLRYHYWRFGFGPRQCMGKYVADLVINILLVHLMKNYRLSLHEKTHWVKNPTMWITHPDTIIRCERI
jgi:cytochrome P450